MPCERTIRKVVDLKGIGLHTGEKVSLRCKPAGPGEGIILRRADVESGQSSFSCRRRTAALLKTQRRSSVGCGAGTVETVEHLLSAFNGLGITNVSVDVKGPEVPALDGSALGFVKAFKAAGIVNQPRKRELYIIREPLFCSSGNAILYALPDESLRITYTLDYDHPKLRAQTVSFEINERVYTRSIAPARTFCTEEESLILRRKGFGKGANCMNTLVIARNGPRRNKFRFEDESARHKILDILGDLAFLGFSIRGHVVGIRSGHALNHRLCELIRLQRS